MSIVPLKKITFLGTVHEKEAILGALQQYGQMHLLSLSGSEATKERRQEKQVERVQQALRYLLDCPRKRRQVEGKADVELHRVVEVIHENMRMRAQHNDRLDWLNKHIEELAPWGDFAFPQGEELAGIRLWFYIVPHYRMKELSTKLVWEVVHQDNQHAYVVVLCEQEPASSDVPVPRAHTGSLPLSSLIEEREQVMIHLEDLEAERESLTRWTQRLIAELVQEENRASYEEALLGSLVDGAIFAVQGWAPARDEPLLQELAGRWGMALLVEDVGEDELPPTLLQNPDTTAGGEELVSFYQTPSYRAWDPSRVVFFSFALFFSMILSDAGYALLLGLGLWSGRKKLKKSIKGQRMLTMGWCITFFSLAYGVLAGSYFGAPPPHPWLRAAQWLDVRNFDQMMTLSVVVGVLHVALANLVQIWQRWGRLQMMASLGWLFVLLGGFLWWRGMSPLGGGLLSSGCVLIVGFSGDRAVHSFRDFFYQLLQGFLALTNLSKAFGDILSYLRLFALGLASASLAVTFNKLAGDVWSSLPGLGFFLAFLILLLGHALNFVLSIVSGVVHGLRLNVIEFFNWSLSEEGYPFQPFSKKEVRSWNT